MDERDWKNELDGYQFVGDEAGEDIDELIKSTKRELEHNEQILSGKRPERPQEEEQNDPADEPELFTPKLPVEYADLTVEEEPVAAEPVKKKRPTMRDQLSGQSMQARAFSSVHTEGGSLSYGVGDRVSHMKFGEGTVKAIVPGGRDFEVTVDFDAAGTKKMFAAFAKLKKV